MPAGGAGGHRAWGAALLPTSSITLQRRGCATGPARNCRQRAKPEALSLSGNSNRRLGGWREVFLTWGRVEVVLLHLSIRSLVLQIGWARA